MNAKTCFLYVLNLVLVWSVSMRWCRVLEVYSTYLMTRPVSLCLCDCPSYIVYACQYSRVFFNPHVLALLKHSINNNFKEPYSTTLYMTTVSRMSWIMDKLGLFCQDLLLLSLDYSTLPYNIIFRGCANKHGASHNISMECEKSEPFTFRWKKYSIPFLVVS